MFRLLLLMFMHIRLICALIKITYLLTYLCSAAGNVTAGLAESNGSLPPGG